MDKIKVYLKAGTRVEITEGQYEGAVGIIKSEFKSSFGKQFLDVQVPLAHKPDGEPIRLRRSDVKEL